MLSKNKGNVSYSSSSGGIGFIGMLTILFIGLKLTDYITWSWLWVLSPIWISSSLVLLFLVFTFAIIMFGLEKQ